MAQAEALGEIERSKPGGRVAIVRIVRPPHNLLDESLLRALADALAQDEADDEVRATVLTSQGRTFSGGANLNDGPTAGPEGFYRQALRLFDHPKPIVAAVQGAAIGGGLGLALAADFRVAAPEARFAATFARLGIHHGFGLTVTLPAAVGEQASRDMLLTGRSVSGEEARAIGLCDRLAPFDELEASALALAGEIAAAAPLAVESIRATLRAELRERVEKAIARESAEQARLVRTADFQEGVAAIKARRDPDFRRA
jgi:enoyl-CoA hydratase/carnithine racemase